MNKPLRVLIVDDSEDDTLLPEFNVEVDLSIWQSIGEDLPIIVISGAIGEEDAVALLKAGAFRTRKGDGRKTEVGYP